MATSDKLNFVSQEIQLYFGMFIVVFGFIGNLLNMIIFLTLQTFRETSCGLYLISISMINIGQILVALFIRILSEAFHTNIRGIRWICKFQVATATWCHLVSLTTLCLATTDQWISMSQYRELSNRRFARRAIILTCIVYLIVWIFNLLYWDSLSGTCSIINAEFAKYSSYFQYPILMGLFSLSMMTIFSSLAFYKIRQMSSQEMHIIRLSHDRQLTAMTLCHAVSVVVATLPFLITFIYMTVHTVTDIEEKAQINLIYTIVLLINYASFAVSSTYLLH